VKKHEVRGWIEETGIIAAVRVYSAEDALFAAEAVVKGGIPVVEIALTVPQATNVIAHLVKSIPNIVVGAGGVRKVGTAHRCLDAGARFLTCDGLHPAVTEFAAQEEVVGIPHGRRGRISSRSSLASRSAVKLIFDPFTGCFLTFR
jgi:2-dehydro-3-deoxyphosphogluconate aldolase / (4S)-4-hydroxy-2-oxoglutarate aldolase